MDLNPGRWSSTGGTMIVSIVTLSALLLAGSAFADDDSIRAKLIGRWQNSDGNGDAKYAWALESSGGSIHLTNSNGTQTRVEFECNTVGKECAVKDAGRSAKVIMYFNGPKLVELETRGTQVVKRRFSIIGDGDTMELETIPIVPTGKSETTHFKRVPSVVAKQ
jgi:hypothetical protein